MKYCMHCGQPVQDEAVVCIYCGRSLRGSETSKDSGSVGYGFLGFLIPIIGLVLYLVWKSERPRTAKMAGMGALIGVILQVVSYIIIYVLLGTVVSAFY